MGTMFLNCGLWGLFTRMNVCESRTQVIAFLVHMQLVSPVLELVGYDAWCQIEDALRGQCPASLKQRRGVHDRWHGSNHKRCIATPLSLQPAMQRGGHGQP